MRNQDKVDIVGFKVFRRGKKARYIDMKTPQRREDARQTKLRIESMKHVVWVMAFTSTGSFI